MKRPKWQVAEARRLRKTLDKLGFVIKRKGKITLTSNLKIGQKERIKNWRTYFKWILRWINEVNKKKTL